MVENQSAALIVDQLHDAGIRLVATLPDGWLADVISAVDDDDQLMHVRVNREESAIGLCSGAFFGGMPSAAVMGASGLMTCIYAISKISYTYEIPILVLTTLRGSIGDRAAHHVSNGLYLEAVLQALRLPYVIVDSPDQMGEVARAYHHSRIMNRATVVAFTRRALRG